MHFNHLVIIRKNILLLFIMAIIGLPLLAQNKVMIKGKIEDGTSGKVLPFANVFCKHNITKGTVSDMEGRFNLEIKNSELNDTLVISFIGYKEKYIPIKQIIGNTMNIQLFPFSNRIDEAVVKARRIISEEFTIEKIEQMDIYLNPLSKADPLLAVNGMASSTTTDESANISLRGSSPAETGIFFNDVPVYDAVRFSQINGIGTFSIFNTSIVDQMHVFPSNPPLEYGNSTSGLVSIQTSDQISDIKYHSFMASLASLGMYSSGKFNDNNGITVFSNYQPSGLFININSDAMKDLESFTSGDIGIHYMHYFNNKSRFKLFNYVNFEGFEYFLRHPSYNGTLKQKKKRDFVISNFTRQFPNGEFVLNGGASFSNENYTHGNTDIDLDKVDLFLSANYYHFFNKLNIKSGLSYDRRENELSGSFPVVDYAKSPAHPSVMVTSRENVPVTEGFTYIKYNASSALVLGLGARKNIPSHEQKNYLSYQANLRYIINKLQSLTVSGGKYNKYSTPNADIHGNFFISCRQGSLDYEYKNGSIEMSSALFVKFAEIQGREEEIVGGELFTKIIISDKLEGQASYTYLNATVNDMDLSYPSKYDMGYFVRASVKYTTYGNLSMSGIFLARQGAYYSPVISSQFDPTFGVYRPEYSLPDDLTRHKDYAKLDISASKLIALNDNINLIVFVNISNLLDRKNMRMVNYSNDYSIKFNEYFSKRSIYFGGIINFQ